MKIGNIADHEDLQSGQNVTMAGMISLSLTRVSKKGNRYCTFRLEDRSGGIKCVVMGESLSKLAELLRDDELVTADGRIESAEGQEPTLRIEGVRSLIDAEAERARTLTVIIPPEFQTERHLESLYNLLERDRGRCEVYLALTAGGTAVKLRSESLGVYPSRMLQRDLEAAGYSVDWQR